MPQATSNQETAICALFAQKLAQLTHASHDGRKYIRVGELKNWLRKRSPPSPYTNAEQLALNAYKNTSYPKAVFKTLDGSLLTHRLDDGNLNLTLDHGIYRDLEDALRQEQDHYARWRAAKHDFAERRLQFTPVTFALGDHAAFSYEAILPFCLRAVINDKGGTASLSQVLIQEEFLDDSLKREIEPFRYQHDQYGACYELVIKCYDDYSRNLFEGEKDTYQALGRTKNLIQCLGSYSVWEPDTSGPSTSYTGDDVGRKRTHNLILPWGSEDLDEYFVSKIEPPVFAKEIYAFWINLFKVAEALSELHNFKYQGPSLFDIPLPLMGWHGDVKPDNILNVNEEFKLIDLGFAKVKRGSSADEPEHFLGGTETYGPPERDANRVQASNPSSLGTLQKADTWSFGATLSVAATWVVLGRSGITKYAHVRMTAIENLKKKHEVDSATHVPKGSDTFHDGWDTLPEVRHWHNSLRHAVRKSDVLTPLVLGMVDDHLLQADPDKRVTAETLCDMLGHITFAATLVIPSLPPLEPSLITTLIEINKTAISHASSQRASTLTTATVPTVDALSTNRQSLLSNNAASTGEERQRKVHRPDDLAPVQTAYRSRLQAAPAMIAIRRKPNNATASPATPPTGNGTASTTAPLSPMLSSPTVITSPIAEGRNRRISVIAHEQNASPVEIGQLSRAPTMKSYGDLEAIQTQSQLHPGLDFDASAGFQRMGSVTRLSSDESRHQRSRESSQAAIEFRSIVALDENHSILRQIPGHSTVDGAKETLKAIGRSLDIAEVRDQLKQNRFSVSRRKPDTHLTNFIQDRDIVLIVDDGASMRPWWSYVSFTVGTITKKLYGVDKDGLDLQFANSKSLNLEGKRGVDTYNLFQKQVEKAKPAEGSMQGTLMKDVLVDMFRAFEDARSSGGKRKMTLLIFTDGVWEGDSLRGVEENIAQFLKDCAQQPGFYRDRRFSIQFISFGNNTAALERLLRLDNGMSTEHDIADVIDTEPWIGEVKKMITGSMRDDIDDDRASTNGLSPIQRRSTGVQD